MTQDVGLAVFIAALRAWSGDEESFRDVLGDALLRATRESAKRPDLDVRLFEGIEASTGIAVSLLRRYVAGTAPADEAMRVTVLRAAADWLEETFVMTRPSS